MTWWQTLIVAVVPVLITLMITNYAESKRREQDAANVEADRKERAAAVATARREALDDHWRDARLDVMEDLLSTAMSIQYLWVTVAVMSRKGSLEEKKASIVDLRARVDGDDSLDPSTLSMRLRRLLTSIRLQSGPEVREAAYNFTRTLNSALDNLTDVIPVDAADEDPFLEQLSTQQRTFEAAARKELGSSDS